MLKETTQGTLRKSYADDPGANSERALNRHDAAKLLRHIATAIEDPASEVILRVDYTDVQSLANWTIDLATAGGE